MHSSALFWQWCKYSLDGAQTLITFELSAKVLTRTRRRNINTDRLGLKLSPVRAKQPLLFWGSSSEPPWLDLSEEPRRVFVVKQCECLCVYVLEGEYEVGCCEVGWEFDGLRCHLPLCDLRCRGCWRARGSKQAGRGRISHGAGFYEEHRDGSTHSSARPAVTDGERRMTSFIIVCKS